MLLPKAAVLTRHSARDPMTRLQKAQCGKMRYKGALLPSSCDCFVGESGMAAVGVRYV